MTAVDDEIREPQQEEAPEQPQAQHSFLIIDCGHINTTALLFDVVDGAYRFVARGSSPTTIEAPWSDAIRGVQQAIGQIVETTGRTLLDQQGTLIRPAGTDGRGVDYFGAVVSAADPLKAIVVGLLDDVSLASARRVLDTIYADEVDSFSLADTRGQQSQINALLAHKPDLVLLSGGTDGGADSRLMAIVETISIGLSMMEAPGIPVVVFAGNKRLRPAVSEALGNLTSLHVADNVRPTLETEQLDSAIALVGELYEARKVGGVPGIAEVFGWSNFPVMPTAHAFAGITEYFAALYRGRVMALDVGSDNVTFAIAEPDNLRLVVRSDLGMGRPMGEVLNKIPPAEILEWMVPAITPIELRNFILNKALYPQTTPLTEEELYIEQAIARQIIRLTVDEALESWGWTGVGKLPPFELLLLRGGALTNVPRLSQAILMVLDAMQPTGIFPIAMDRHGILPALGLLAPHEPLVVIQSLEGGVLVDLGWVIAPKGRAQKGQTVLNVRMDSEDGGSLQIEVAFGSLEVLPLASGQTAQLTLQPQRRFDIGFGPGKAKKVRVQGGAVGLVIDARGRPLTLPEEEDARRNRLHQWLWDVGA